MTQQTTQQQHNEGTHSGVTKQTTEGHKQQVWDRGCVSRKFSPMNRKLQQSENVGGHGGQCQVVPLRPDLRHHHTLVDV